jgi:hypothetical protein
LAEIRQWDFSHHPDFADFPDPRRPNSPRKKLFASPVTENPDDSDLFEEDP